VRTRRFGGSDLEVSEVGFGAWTLVMPWWGEVADPAGLVHAALDAGITFFDTAPVYGDGGAGESLLAEILGSTIHDVVITTKCGYDIHGERIAPGHSERPHDWDPKSVRLQCEHSLHRLGLERIDLYQLHNPTIDPIRADDLWAELEALRDEGKVAHLGVALGPAIGWVTEGVEALDGRPMASIQTVFNILEQEPGRTFLGHPAVRGSHTGVIARVPHASDALTGSIDRDTVFADEDHRKYRNRENLLDLLDKAAALDFLAGPEQGRTLAQAAIAGILAFDGITTVLPTCTTPEQVRDWAAASERPLSADEKERLDRAWSENFGVTDRVTIEFKTSV
jgi:aryl-alcohol dehydrogenase-like predicted oxidoreductase